MKKLHIIRSPSSGREICLLLCLILIVFNSYKIFFQSQYLSTKVVIKSDIIYDVVSSVVVSEVLKNGSTSTIDNDNNNNNNNNNKNNVTEEEDLRRSSSSSIGNNITTSNISSSSSSSGHHHHHHHHHLIVDNATNNNMDNNKQQQQKKKNFTSTTLLVVGGKNISVSTSSSSSVLLQRQPPKQQQQQQQDIVVVDSSSSEKTDDDIYRLELLHIPKTGGTFLEIAAANNNIVWGACHFSFAWKRRPSNPLRICPTIDSNSSINVNPKHVLWHYPLQSWPNTNTNTNTNKKSNSTTDTDDDSMMPYHKGYDALLDLNLKDKPKRFFVVIRNPYEKIISLYYMRGPKNPKQINNPVIFNDWIQDKINKELNQFCYESCGMTPQYHYVYYNDSNGKGKRKKRRMVHHILRLENLHEDFDKELRQQYNFLTDFVIPSKKVNVNNRKNNNKFDVTNFNNITLSLINDVYGKDFILGNYTKFSWEDILILKKKKEETEAEGSTEWK